MSSCQQWVLLAVCGTVLVGCSGHAGTVPAKTPAALSPYALAKEFVEYVRAEQWAEVYPRMARGYRDANSARDLETAYSQMVTWYGKPLRFDYKGESAGQLVSPDGVARPINKYWFATPTPSHPSGVYSFVEVVHDEGGPAVATFSIVMFQADVPGFLK